MSFFMKGDFKINDSWEQLKEKERSKEKEKEKVQRPSSRERPKEMEKNKSLVNAGKIIAEPTTDILDDELSKRILKDFASEMPGSARLEKKPQPKEESIKLPPRQKVNPPQSETDLLTSMATRLKTVEQTCKHQRQQIRQKLETIDKLKAENTFLKGFKEDSAQQFQKMQNLQSQNTELRIKVEQMQTYLKKYGLKWVGNKIEGKLEHEKMKKEIHKGNYNYRLPSEIDINTIIRRAGELNNGLHSEGMGTQIYQENGVHKFKKAEPLPMGFFANGIAIKGYKFFPYKSKESLQILGDLIDGYFPFVLKARFPNGVFLKVVDKIAEKYENESSNETISTFESNDNKDFKPPSKEQFLNKLPKQVIKNGKVINIRSQIEKRLNGSPEEKDNAEEQTELYERIQGALVIKSNAYFKIQGQQLSQESVCTLKIRNQQGEVYILHLQSNQTMKDVYSWLRRLNKSSFKVMGNFPRRCYESTEPNTLESLGFFPNAMLHIQSTTNNVSS